MTETICIVQARSDSNRLPKKVLLDLCGKTVLETTLDRCNRISGVDRVICATSTEENDDEIASLVQRTEHEVYRGSKNDVLDRFVKVSSLYKPQNIIRITADCPLIDPVLVGQFLSEFRLHNVSWGCFSHWPHGLDAEIFRYECLLEASEKAVDPRDREHISRWLSNQLDRPRLIFRPGFYKEYLASEYRWVLDYSEDYEFLKAILAAFDHDETKINWQAVFRILKEFPDLQSINERCIEIWRAESRSKNFKPRKSPFRNADERRIWTDQQVFLNWETSRFGTEGLFPPARNQTSR